jgi:hypothetical protein
MTGEIKPLMVVLALAVTSYVGVHAAKACIAGNDLYAGGPVMMVLGIGVIGIAGGLVLISQLSERKPQTARWLRRTVILLPLALAAILSAVGMWQHAAATVVGSPLRGQIVSVRDVSSSRSLMRTYRTTIAFADGTQLISDHLGRSRFRAAQCIIVSRLIGRFGFTWLRFVDALPADGSLPLAVPDGTPPDCLTGPPLVAVGR